MPSRSCSVNGKPHEDLESRPPDNAGIVRNLLALSRDSLALADAGPLSRAVCITCIDDPGESAPDAPFLYRIEAGPDDESHVMLIIPDGASKDAVLSILRDMQDAIEDIWGLLRQSDDAARIALAMRGGKSIHQDSFDLEDAKQEVYNLAIDGFLSMPEAQQAGLMRGMPTDRVERLLSAARAMNEEATPRKAVGA